jgi:PAS domain S-box-containing protein
LLLLGTLLPLVVLAAVTVVYVAWNEFQSTKSGLQNTARALAAAVDREIQASITTLEALATSEMIDDEKLRELHHATIRLVPTQPGWRTVILHDPDGNNLFHSSFPFGTPRPGVFDSESFGRLLTSLRPTVMDYTPGPVSGPTIGVRVPVLRNGKLKYVLTANIDAARLDEILREQGLTDSRYAVVYDNTRAQIASSTGLSPKRRGDRTGPLIGQVPAEVATAWVSGPNRAGVESYGAFVRAPLSRFYLAIIVPASEVANTLLNSIWIVSGFSVLAVLTVLLLTSLYGRRLTGYTQYLVDLAHTIGAGKPVQVGVAKPVKEITLIDNAIAEASALLQNANAARSRFEAELQETSNKLHQANLELQIITDTMAAAVARCDRERIFLWASKQLCNWLGRSPNEIIGRSVFEVLGAELYALIERNISTVLSGKTVDFEIKRPRPEHGPQWIRAIYSPTYDADDAVNGWVAVLTDIDEQKRSEEGLKDANRRKDEFLAMLGHELRNPLSIISSSVQVLDLTGAQTGEAQEMREIITRQTAQMAKLIDDLLEVSRIASGMIHLQREACDLARITEKVTNDYRFIAESSGIKIEVEITDRPIWVTGDPTRLAQILTNLLNNGCKFTPAPGTVTISLRADPKRGALLAVRDSGAGIEADMIDRIFEPFIQAEQTVARSQGGLGLGLALVKGLVELHAGTVSVVSAGRGKGSEFIVQLPIRTQLEISKPNENRASAEVPSLRIAIIDDNRAATRTLEVFLKLKGHAVEIANDGQDGLTLMRRFLPDVVLCDIGLPILDGYALARQIRSDHALRAVYLVAVTGYGQGEDQVRARNAGFDEYLVKPINLRTLEELMAKRFSIPASKTA